MAYKQTVAINKHWVHGSTSGFTLNNLITKLRNVVNNEIPVGYQDETGFHTGVKSATKEIKWPTTW